MMFSGHILVQNLLLFMDVSLFSFHIIQQYFEQKPLQKVFQG